MRKLGLHQVRKEFLDFFEEKGHLVHDSYSLVPVNDKSLLLIGAGMAPLKKYFTGELVPPKARMSTCQKCMRTGDLENVGVTARHATFFEMLGNFSFGDYFKKEAIHWAWEFLTERLEIDKDLLWVTVYLDDDEAYEIWEKEIGLPKERIVRLGKEDNFWELEVGPSGPCSEIHIDRGPKYGDDTQPGGEGDRFLEVWNLVFTQFDKDAEGNYHPLANPNIDTGMGLERITAVLEGADNIFEIEAIQDIIKKIEEISAYKYGSNQEKDMSVRVITDHIRAMTFLASDMVIPSNEGRGYVMRRIIRRAARHGKLLGIEDLFLTDLAQVVIDSWSVSYKELKEKENKILSVIRTEEEKFAETLDKGIEILSSYIEDLKKEGETILQGSDAFKLYDTYGFPLDLTKEILIEENLQVDEAGFKKEMERQREMARSASQAGENVGWSAQDSQMEIQGSETSFLGYQGTEGSGKIVQILKDGAQVNSLDQGQKGALILDASSFYPEGGGQIGDKGLISNENFSFVVEDTKKTKSGIILHLGKLESGKISLGDQAQTLVDQGRRRAIARNHSATHLLNAALKKVLGDHVNQAGSEVTDKAFRFDFSHYEGLSKDQVREIEDLVNQFIYQEIESEIYEKSITEAYDEGAIGIFEDKYKDKVRIVSFPGVSKELCGGTHVKKTSDIGIFKILSEAGIASGVRRIEATTGSNVYKILKDLEGKEEKLIDILKANKGNLLEKAQGLVEENKNLNKDLEDLKRQSARKGIDDILNSYKEVAGFKVLKARIDGQDVNSLRDLADEIRDKLGSAVVVLGTENEGKVNFVVTVSKDLIPKKLNAGKIIKEVAAITKGGGGGRPDMATAGGKDAEKLDEALDSVYHIVENLL
ncbi:MAG: alanine--tRNA ligase [Bacillota bacterium]|nr:alanine--tRNA ligase [Bacillota bacterium]